MDPFMQLLQTPVAAQGLKKDLPPEIEARMKAYEAEGIMKLIRKDGKIDGFELTDKGLSMLVTGVAERIRIAAQREAIVRAML